MADEVERAAALQSVTWHAYGWGEDRHPEETQRMFDPSDRLAPPEFHPMPLHDAVQVLAHDSGRRGAEARARAARRLLVSDATAHGSRDRPDPPPKFRSEIDALGFEGVDAPEPPSRRESVLAMLLGGDGPPAGPMDMFGSLAADPRFVLDLEFIRHAEFNQRSPCPVATSIKVESDSVTCISRVAILAVTPHSLDDLIEHFHPESWVCCAGVFDAAYRIAEPIELAHNNYPPPLEPPTPPGTPWEGPFFEHFAVHFVPGLYWASYKNVLHIESHQRDANSWACEYRMRQPLESRIFMNRYGGAFDVDRGFIAVWEPPNNPLNLRAVVATKDVRFAHHRGMGGLAEWQNRLARGMFAIFMDQFVARSVCCHELM